MKKFLSILCIFWLIFWNIGSIFAYEFKIWEQKYSCPWIDETANSDWLCRRVAETCNWQNNVYDGDISFYEKDKKIIKKTLEYNDYQYYKQQEWFFSVSPFDKAQEIYKTNMKNIYQCGMNQIKQKSIKQIEKNSKVNVPSLKKELLRFFVRQELKLKNAECVRKKKPEDMVTKEEFLKITTYEMCKYQTYLQYLKEDYYWDLSNIAPDNLKLKDINTQKQIDNLWNAEKKSIYVVLEEQRVAKNNIDKEIARTYSIFKKAYRTYLAYEWNYNIHLWLEVLKVDIKTYNKILKWVLWPLAQVVPKILNAMRHKR